MVAVVRVGIGGSHSNVTEPLEARLRVRTHLNRTPQYKPEQVVQVTGDVDREFTVRFEMGDIKDGECHELQLAVSGSFLHRDPPNPGLFDITDDADDLALASWLIWEGKESDADNVPDQQAGAIVNTCEIGVYMEDTP